MLHLFVYIFEMKKEYLVGLAVVAVYITYYLMEAVKVSPPLIAVSALRMDRS